MLVQFARVTRWDVIRDDGGMCVPRSHADSARALSGFHVPKLVGQRCLLAGGTLVLFVMLRTMAFVLLCDAGDNQRLPFFRVPHELFRVVVHRHSH